tara:strand:- start:384 stop:710 length:327 start_codon:yes stop_codon:yes gene_type:complete
MTNIYDDDKINKIITLYKKRVERDRIKYEKKKNDPVFIEQNRSRAKAHYEAHYKEVKKQNYNKNKDVVKAKSLFYYYRRNDRVDEFIIKYPDKVELMGNHGITVSGSG